MAEYKRVFVTIDNTKAIPAYVDTKDTWNGCAKPYFRAEDTYLIADLLRLIGDDELVYNERDDAYECVSDDGSEVYEGVDVTFGTASLHLYPIGAGLWVWSIMCDEDYDQIVPKHVLDVLEDNDMSIRFDYRDKNMLVYELEAYTESGGDMIHNLYVNLSEVLSVDEWIFAFKDMVDDFDTAHEAFLWCDESGKPQRTPFDTFEELYRDLNEYKEHKLELIKKQLSMTSNFEPPTREKLYKVREKLMQERAEYEDNIAEQARCRNFDAAKAYAALSDQVIAQVRMLDYVLGISEEW